MTIRSRITLTSIAVILLVSCVLLFAARLSQNAAEARYVDAVLAGGADHETLANRRTDPHRRRRQDPQVVEEDPAR